MDVKKRYFFVGLLALIAISGPFLYAIFKNNSEWIFGGFLLNPVDGHSYLAKMQQGLNGNWKFTLPYTAEPGEGAYLFLFYISLGHFARLFDLSLISMFHTARLLGSLFLISTIWKFVKTLNTDEKFQFYSFVVLISGSGLGWLAVITGKFTSDFWVAEAYPFLSMYANPHFPIGLGLMILMVIPGKNEILKSILIGFPLAIIQPFSIVILLVIFVIRLTIEIWEIGAIDHKIIVQSHYFNKTLGLGLAGGLILLYQYWSIQSDPVLSIWNSQNQTPPPDLVDFLFSFLPVVVMGLFGAKDAWKTNMGKTLLVWSVSSILLLFIPWNLPRRFLTGIFVPLGGLTIFGLKNITKNQGPSFLRSLVILLILILPTNIIILISGIQAAKNFDQSIYYSNSLGKCFEWINNNIEVDKLIMADEKVGLLIPSTTGNRVIYGHPFETANADRELEFISGFYSKQGLAAADIGSLTDRHIDFLLVQENSKLLSKELDPGLVRIVYENPDYVLYELLNQ